MSQKIINVFMFATGAAIGSLVTWKVVRAKYERIIQEEIDSFKEDYIRCMSRQSSENETYGDEDMCDEDGEFDESIVRAYNEIATTYSTASKVAETDEKGAGDEEVPYINGPYVITPEEFGDGNYDHSLYYLTYYADGVLADDWYVKMDLDEIIGEGSIDHFGDYAENVVHVRNEREAADYEVTKDPRRYVDVIADDPLVGKYAT